MNEPTDAELLAEWDRVSHIADAGQRRLACLRAALAKWGAPAPVGVEPIGVVGYTVHGTQYVNWLSKAPAYGTPIYTTPQPTQAQAWAVPFTNAQRERLFYNRPYSIGKGLAMADWHRVVQYVEAAHGIGIKGGQHGADN